MTEGVYWCDLCCTSGNKGDRQLIYAEQLFDNVLRVSERLKKWWGLKFKREHKVVAYVFDEISYLRCFYRKMNPDSVKRIFCMKINFYGCKKNDQMLFVQPLERQTKSI